MQHTSTRHRPTFHAAIITGLISVIIPTTLLANQVVQAETTTNSTTPYPSPTELSSNITSADTTHPTITPSPTLTPTTTDSTVTLQSPTYTAPTTTAPINPLPTNTAVTVPPYLMVANTYKPLVGSTTISVAGSPDTKVDIQLQPENGQVGSLFITRINIGSSTKATYTWNTTNTPDGTYKLYAIFHHDNQPDIILGPVQLQIANNTPATTSTKPTPVATSSATAAPAAQSDIAYPAEFSPANIKTDATLTVDPPTNTKLNDQLAITFSGKSLPNTVLTLLIFSNPIVVTVKADANGVWTYNLDKPLTPGKHEAYVVVTKPDQTRVRSEVASFFVAPALAASQNGESLQLASATEDNLTTTFIIGTIIVVILGVAGVVGLYTWKRRRQPTYAKAPTAV